MTEEINKYSKETLAIRTGHHQTHELEHSEPMFLTSSFTFASAEEAAAKFSGDTPGNIYGRFTNPTVSNFEQRLAALEETECCVATSSGMSAILSVCMGLLQKGDHIVSSSSVFGTTTVLFEKYLTKFGIETTFVELTDVNAWKAAIRPSTKMFFLETPSNPLTRVANISELADLAHNNDAKLVIDNCFCTPILQQPVKLGADIVVHSATKYLDGQGRILGGAVCGNNQLVGEHVYGVLRSCGPIMSPFNAWVALKGLETLSLRMRAHCASATKLAKVLSTHSSIEKVYHLSLDSHPEYELAQKQQSDVGAIVSFEVVGDKQKAWDLINKTKMISITANLGDAKTTITHPASTTHGRLLQEQRDSAGISDRLIRVSVGLENIDDIIRDIELGL